MFMANVGDIQKVVGNSKDGLQRYLTLNTRINILVRDDA
jgi:hypothetical protein